MGTNTASVGYGLLLAMLLPIGQVEAQTTGGAPGLVGEIPPRKVAGPGKSPDVVKPPFTATPLGQPLSPGIPRSDMADGTPTPHSPRGGYPGKMRSGNTVDHYGLDDTGKNNNEISRFTGTEPGVVTKSSKAYNEKGEYLGQRVEIEFRTKDGVWNQKTLHHKKVFVEPGQIVVPGQPIAEGKGEGDQFKSGKAGKPHVHFETRLNGELRHPLDGTRLSGPKQPLSGKPLPSELPRESERGGPEVPGWVCSEMKKNIQTLRTIGVDGQTEQLLRRSERMCEQGSRPSVGRLP